MSETENNRLIVLPATFSFRRDEYLAVYREKPSIPSVELDLDGMPMTTYLARRYLVCLEGIDNYPDFGDFDPDWKPEYLLMFHELKDGTFSPVAPDPYATLRIIEQIRQYNQNPYDNRLYQYGEWIWVMVFTSDLGEVGEHDYSDSPNPE